MGRDESKRSFRRRSSLPLVSDDSAPARRAVRLSRLTVHFLSWGPEDGPLALCLHGYPDTAWTWRHLGPALAARGWRVVAPFQRGYAPTDLAPDGRYETGALAGDLLELRAVLGGGERSVLIGHDWGAVVGYAATAHDPAAFGKLVALSVPPLPGVVEVAGDLRRGDTTVLRQLPHSWYALLNTVPVVSEALLWRMVGLLWRTWSPGYEPDEDLAHLADALPDRAHRTAALRYYRHFAAPGGRARGYAVEQRSALAAPRVPTLYLHGERDGCAIPGLARHAYRHLPSGSDVGLIPGVGHFMHLERPCEVNARVAGFLTAEGDDHVENDR